MLTYAARRCVLILWSLLLAAGLYAAQAAAPPGAPLPVGKPGQTYMQGQSLSSLMTSINRAHAGYAALPPPGPPDRYALPLGARDVGLTDAELQSLTRYDRRLSEGKTLSAEDAKSDVDLLFKTLRCTYGGYTYFGGDPAFENARKNILSWALAKGEALTVGDLKRYILYELRFIRDGHFTVSSQRVSLPRHFFADTAVPFFQDSAGFYCLRDGQKRYIRDIDGNPHLSFRMFLSVDPDGALVYYVGSLGNTLKQQLTARVTLEHHDTLQLTLTRPSLYDRQRDRADEAALPSQIPIARVGSFGAVDEPALLSDAARLGGSPLAILDLRGNGGGSVSLMGRWLDAFYGADQTDSPPQSGGYAINFQTRAVGGLMLRLARAGEDTLSRYYYPGYTFSTRDIAYLQSAADSGVNRSLVTRRPNRRMPRSGLLVVLMDKDTMSAAEHLIAGLMNMDNVLFIGTNSYGATLSDKGIPVVLPRSGLELQYGSSLYILFNEGVVNEEMGFCPDIWVPEDALTRTLALLARQQGESI